MDAIMKEFEEVAAEKSSSFNHMYYAEDAKKVIERCRELGMKVEYVQVVCQTPDIKYYDLEFFEIMYEEDSETKNHWDDAIKVIESQAADNHIFEIGYLTEEELAEREKIE